MLFGCSDMFHSFLDGIQLVLMLLCAYWMFLYFLVKIMFLGGYDVYVEGIPLYEIGELIFSIDGCETSKSLDDHLMHLVTHCQENSINIFVKLMCKYKKWKMRRNGPHLYTLTKLTICQLWGSTQSRVLQF